MERSISMGAFGQWAIFIVDFWIFVRKIGFFLSGFEIEPRTYFNLMIPTLLASDFFVLLLHWVQYAQIWSRNLLMTVHLNFFMLGIRTLWPNGKVIANQHFLAHNYVCIIFIIWSDSNQTVLFNNFLELNRYFKWEERVEESIRKQNAET